MSTIWTASYCKMVETLAVNLIKLQISSGSVVSWLKLRTKMKITAVVYKTVRWKLWNSLHKSSYCTVQWHIQNGSEGRGFQVANLSALVKVSASRGVTLLVEDAKTAHSLHSTMQIIAYSELNNKNYKRGEFSIYKKTGFISI